VPFDLTNARSSTSIVALCTWPDRQPLPFFVEPPPGRPLARDGILYLMPWMVIGGADLYDYYVLQHLHSLGTYRITLVIEHALPWPHPWKVRGRPCA